MLPKERMSNQAKKAEKKIFNTNFKIQIFIIHMYTIHSIVYKGGNLNKPKTPKYGNDYKLQDQILYSEYNDVEV